MTLLTVRDIAEQTGVSLETVIKIVQRGEVEAVAMEPAPKRWGKTPCLYPDSVVSDFFSKDRIRGRRSAAEVIAGDLRAIIGWVEISPSLALRRTATLWNRVTRRSRRRRILNTIKSRRARALDRTGLPLLSMDPDPLERR